MLKNAPVKRTNGDGEIHALSGLMYCKECGTKMHIRTIHKNGRVQHVTYCSEYAKGKAKHPKCNSPHRNEFISKIVVHERDVKRARKHFKINCLREYNLRRIVASKWEIWQ